MDKLIEKIIEKTELKNWTLFLFIFAISFTVGLQIITGHWFHIPDAKDKFNNTTLFLLEVFLSSLTITRLLVAIKFLEAVNRTPIIADFINWVVVERKFMMKHYDILSDEKVITGEIKGTRIDYWLTYKNGITELEACILIDHNNIVEGEFPFYQRCKEVVMGKTQYECSKKGLAITGSCIFKLNPALYRHLDKNEYGGFWIPQRSLCLEHFILAVCGGVIGILIIKGCIAIGLLICRCMF